MRIAEPAMVVALAHERRRDNPMPPRELLIEDEAIAIVRAEEARRAGERVNEAFRKATSP